MRLIDADVLKDKVLNWMPSDPCGIAEKEHPIETDIVVSLMMEIEESPTIDAVEVVRCKECKHYSVEGETTQFGWCNALEMPTDEQRFCSDGERREP